MAQCGLVRIHRGCQVECERRYMSCSAKSSLERLHAKSVQHVADAALRANVDLYLIARDGGVES